MKHDRLTKPETAPEIGDYYPPPVQGRDVLPAIHEVLADPSASTWIKNALANAVRRDPVDAVEDAVLLYCLLSARARVICGAGSGNRIDRFTEAVNRQLDSKLTPGG